MKHGIGGRILITLVGAVLILYNVGSPLLGVIGEKGVAVVTSIRRQGGERDESVPGRYTYYVGYTFTLPSGQKVDGSTTTISGAVYLKADGTTTMPVRYLKQVPLISMPEQDTKPSVGNFISIGLGMLIIFVVNKKTKTRNGERTDQ